MPTKYANAPICYGVLTGAGFLQMMPRESPAEAFAARDRASAGARAVVILPLEGEGAEPRPLSQPYNVLAKAISELKNGINQTHGLPQWCHDAVDAELKKITG